MRDKNEERGGGKMRTILMEWRPFFSLSKRKKRKKLVLMMSSRVSFFLMGKENEKKMKNIFFITWPRSSHSPKSTERGTFFLYLFRWWCSLFFPTQCIYLYIYIYMHRYKRALLLVSIELKHLLVVGGWPIPFHRWPPVTFLWPFLSLFVKGRLRFKHRSMAVR